MTPDAPPLSGALRIRDLRRNRALAPGGPEFPQLVRRFLPMVHGIAAALIPDRPESIEAITSSVFETFALKWRYLSANFPSLRTAINGSISLRGRILVGPWLVRTVCYAAARERSRWKLKAKPPTESGQVAHKLFRDLNRLSSKLASSVILSELLGEPVAPKPLTKGLRKLDKPIQKLAAKISRNRAEPFTVDCRAFLKRIPTPPPVEVEQRILEQVAQWTPKTRRHPLTRSALTSWRWRTIGRVFKTVGATIGLIVCLLATIGLTVKILVDHCKISIVRLFITNMQRQTIEEFPDIAKPARPFARRPQRAPKNSAELYNMTNVWLAKLSFTPAQWEAIQPVNIPAAPQLPDGKMALRNSKASRSGLAGAIGIDFHWSEAKFEFADAIFDTVGARFRGNGTYLNSLYGPKTSYKVNVNHGKKGQKIGGVTKLNFVNSIPDFSYVKDALAENLFRELGAVGPRTTYSYLTIDVPGKYTNQALGLYVVIEDIDDDFAKDRFGTKAVPIFKPVTYHLFEDSGKDWSAYKEVYDLKTKATPEQLQRVVDLAQLVSHANDEEFARRIGEFLDFEEYAAFLAGHVLTSSYDGYLSNGQNFYIYLDPRSNKFGFIPWDQDHGWGEFGYVGKAESRENASIWNPASYNNLFLARVLKVEAFKKVYRAKLEEGLAGPFAESKLFPQIDRLAAAIRPAVAAESDFRLKRFNLAVKSAWIKGVRDEGSMNDGSAEGPKAFPHQIKRFVTTRTKSVRDQLDGKSEGSKLTGF